MKVSYTNGVAFMKINIYKLFEKIIHLDVPEDERNEQMSKLEEEEEQTTIQKGEESGGQIKNLAINYFLNESVAKVALKLKNQDEDC